MFIYKRQYVTCVTTMISQKRYYENFMSFITGHGLNKVVTRLAVYDIYRQLLILLRVDCHKPLDFLRTDTFFDTQGKLRKLIFYDLYMYRVFFFTIYCFIACWWQFTIPEALYFISILYTRHEMTWSISQLSSPVVITHWTNL